MLARREITMAYPDVGVGVHLAAGRLFLGRAASCSTDTLLLPPGGTIMSSIEDHSGSSARNSTTKKQHTSMPPPPTPGCTTATPRAQSRFSVVSSSGPGEAHTPNGNQPAPSPGSAGSLVMHTPTDPNDICPFSPENKFLRMGGGSSPPPLLLGGGDTPHLTHIHGGDTPRLSHIWGTETPSNSRAGGFSDVPISGKVRACLNVGGQ